MEKLRRGVITFHYTLIMESPEMRIFLKLGSQRMRLKALPFIKQSFSLNLFQNVYSPLFMYLLDGIYFKVIEGSSSNHHQWLYIRARNPIAASQTQRQEALSWQVSGQSTILRRRTCIDTLFFQRSGGLPRDLGLVGRPSRTC